jgi:(3,5-dihydroxyphenyl)acetyl-CoA 1,2-dioxygenase
MLSEKNQDQALAQLDIDIVSLAAFVATAQNGVGDVAASTNMVRQARRRFLEQHIDAVYNALTDRHGRSVRLEVLVSAAADMFPALLPNSAEIAQETARRQTDKLGLAIDQALFVRAVLASPVAGPHLVETMLGATEQALALQNEFESIGRIALDTVVVERLGAVGYVTLANFDCLNAEDLPLLRDLETAVDLVLLDPKIKVGVLRGAVMKHPKYAGRRVFCSGLNLKALRDGCIPIIEFLVVRELGLVNKLRWGLMLPGRCGPYGPCLDKPWIAAVDSFAIGGGVQMLLVVDHVVAASNATFSLPASKEGFVPGAANLRLGRYVGARLARRLILDGKTLSAEEPDAAMLCDLVVPPEQMDTAVEAAAIRFSSESILANRRVLTLAEEPLDDLRRYLAEFALIQALRMHSRDVTEAAEAFRSSTTTSEGGAV